MFVFLVKQKRRHQKEKVREFFIADWLHCVQTVVRLGHRKSLTVTSFFRVMLPFNKRQVVSSQLFGGFMFDVTD